MVEVRETSLEPWRRRKLLAYIKYDVKKYICQNASGGIGQDPHQATTGEAYPWKYARIQATQFDLRKGS
jgi:hypothetical protein